MNPRRVVINLKRINILLIIFAIVFLGIVIAINRNNVCAGEQECYSESTKTPEPSFTPEGTSSPSPTATASPAPTSTPPQHRACGHSCTLDSDCRNRDPSYICYHNGTCREESNSENPECTPATNNPEQTPEGVITIEALKELPSGNK